MAITFVGSGVGTHAAVSAQTYNFSSLLNDAGGTPTLQQGDIVYVAVENSTAAVNRGAGALVPSGYTAAHTALYNTDTNASNFQVSYKVMGATPDTSVAIPASNATTSGVAYAVYVFRGVNTTAGPNDVTIVTAGGGNTGVANAAAITPVTAGAWIAVFGGAAVAAGAVFTNPAGMSTTTNHFRSTTITTTTNDANIGGALYTAWTSGAYDPAAFGGSTTTKTGSWSAVTVALKPVVNHTNTGTLTGQIGSVAGTAQRNSSHGTSGALTGAIGSIAGTADRTGGTVTHGTTGDLAGQAGSVAGTAARFRAMSTSGALTGQGSTVAGTAARFRAFSTTGALTGQGSVVDGVADRTGAAVSHDTSGDLTGQGSAIAGTTARFRAFASTGDLVGQGAAVSGTASRTGATVSHDTTGDLSGQGALLSGSAMLGEEAVAPRRRAVSRRQYEIKGKRYWLTPQELEQLIAQMLGELNRNDVVDAENKIITRRAWSRLQNSIKQAESRLEFKLPIETVVIEDEDDDEEALLMLI